MPDDRIWVLCVRLEPDTYLQRKLASTCKIPQCADNGTWNAPGIFCTMDPLAEAGTREPENSCWHRIFVLDSANGCEPVPWNRVG